VPHTGEEPGNGTAEEGGMASALAVGATIAAFASAPAPADEPTVAFEIAQVTRPVALYARRGGPEVARLGAATEFGSPQTLGVVRNSGRWLRVISTKLPNGRSGWVRARAVRLTSTPKSLTIDLSRRLLLFKRGDQVVRRMAVTIGRPGSPTPTGRFAVTDKLAGSNYGPYYGCCILALSAHQPNLPAGWTGGDRIAIHGTNAPSTIGAAASAGCLRAGEADLRILMRRVPLGTPVFIRA
jgi:lipoprotein-anchoring transpeptidase ErfK/SrfK